MSVDLGDIFLLLTMLWGGDQPNSGDCIIQN